MEDQDILTYDEIIACIEYSYERYMGYLFDGERIMDRRLNRVNIQCRLNYNHNLFNTGFDPYRMHGNDVVRLRKWCNRNRYIFLGVNNERGQSNINIQRRHGGDELMFNFHIFLA